MFTFVVIKYFVNIAYMREKLNRQKYIKDNIDVKLDMNQLIEEAKWQVEFYEKEVIRSANALHQRRLALQALYEQKLNRENPEL